MRTGREFPSRLFMGKYSGAPTLTADFVTVFAVALFPFILAFGAKWNIVGFIVGCSHEKLQVFHQWLSHLFCE